MVNAAGPWVDQLLRDVDGAGDRPPRIGGTKGSPPRRRAVPRARRKEALYIEAEDGRPYFVVPWNGLFLIGTTDRRYAGDLDEVVADDEEIDYLISETNAKIPGAGLSRDSVLYTYSGVRPLPHVTDVREGGITRRHIVEDHAENDPRVGRPRDDHRRQDHDLPQPGRADRRPRLRQARPQEPASAGRASCRCPAARRRTSTAFREQFIATSGVARPAAERLLRIYGSRAVEVARRRRRRPRPARAAGRGDRARSAPRSLFAFRAELAQGLDDLLLRRTMVGYNSHVAIGADEAAAEVARRHLAWDEERARAEVERYRRSIGRYRPRDLRAVAGLAATPARRGPDPAPVGSRRILTGECPSAPRPRSARCSTPSPAATSSGR